MQQQQQGGPQYGVTRPEMAPFHSPGAGPRTQILGIPTGPEHHPHHLQQQQQQMVAEAASPISSRPPPAGPSRTNFDELVPPSAPGSFPDEDALAAGEEVERGGVPGNRWPRQETLALLKIRSEMDATFRDATLKGPLWEDVSRKLADLGYSRSAKKCKEKFENVHKYYKRTKEGRAGRQDGKSYRFFTQLEALHSAATPTTTMAAFIPALASVPTPSATVLAPFPSTTIAASSSMPSPPSVPHPPPISAPAPPPTATTDSAAIDLTPAAAPPAIQGSAPTSATAAAAGISFSSDTCSSSSSEYDDEETEEGEGRKRKRAGGGPTGSSKMMAFFEGLMKQVMERQEAMQQRFLETIEKREHDRMIREEAWKRQEMARLNREHELMAQERAMAASRDAAVISFLQKISGPSTPLPPSVVVPSSSLSQPSPAPPQQPPPPPPPQQPHPPSQQPQQIQQPVQHHQKLPAPPPHPQPPQQQQQQQQEQQQVVHLQTQSTEVVRHQPSSTSTALVPVPEPHEFIGSGSFEGVPSSRWPKSEVHALIKLRSDLESRYQEAGPKGPLWEEISAGMQRLGYSRSPKRCKEKWENINKYFKKVKESNKKRPEDAKTCPYFHQLDALYRRKLLASAGAGMLVNQRQQEHDPNTNPPPQERSDVVLSMAPPPPPPPAPHPETESKNGSGGIQMQTINGGLPPSFFEEGASGGTTLKKPEDIVKELMEQDHQQSAAMDDYDKLEEPDSDIDMDDDEDDDDDDGEDSKLQYKIQFQRQNVGGGGNASAGKAAGGAPAGAGGSFLAMVQ